MRHVQETVPIILGINCTFPQLFSKEWSDRRIDIIFFFEATTSRTWTNSSSKRPLSPLGLSLRVLRDHMWRHSANSYLVCCFPLLGRLTDSIFRKSDFLSRDSSNSKPERLAKCLRWHPELITILSLSEEMKMLLFLHFGGREKREKKCLIMSPKILKTECKN